MDSDVYLKYQNLTPDMQAFLTNYQLTTPGVSQWEILAAWYFIKDGALHQAFDTEH